VDHATSPDVDRHPFHCESTGHTRRLKLVLNLLKICDAVHTALTFLTILKQHHRRLDAPAAATPLRESLTLLALHVLHLALPCISGTSTYSRPPVPPTSCSANTTRKRRASSSAPTARPSSSTQGPLVLPAVKPAPPSWIGGRAVQPCRSHEVITPSSKHGIECRNYCAAP
jgi:hypothetical protein